MPTINTGGGVRDLGLFHVCMWCPWGPWRLYCMKLDEPVCWNLEKKYVFQCSCFIKQNVNFRWTLPQPTLRSVSSLTLIFIHWAHWLSKWRFRSFYTQIQSAVLSSWLRLENLQNYQVDYHEIYADIHGLQRMKPHELRYPPPLEIF